MKGMRRIWKILRITKADKILIGFVMFLFGISFVTLLVEPQIKTYGDALWYAFSVVTTIGFGDYHAVTLIGRICTIIMGVYGVLIVALIPGIVVSYYTDFMQTKSEETMGVFLEKLENLESLSKEELREISDKVRERRYKG